MADFLSSPLASVVFLFALTGVLIAIGIFVISKVRAGIHDRELDASEHLTDFRDLYERGELDEQEYKTIKANLSTRLQKELKQSDPEKMH
jgi:5-bromo-4-chloroindolyl phosphate hydrolysis protein